MHGATPRARRRRRTARARSLRLLRHALLVAVAVALIVTSVVIALPPGRAEPRSPAVRLAVERTSVVQRAPIAGRDVEPTLEVAAATPPAPPPWPNPVPPLPRPAALPDA